MSFVRMGALEAARVVLRDVGVSSGTAVDALALAGVAFRCLTAALGGIVADQ